MSATDRRRTLSGDDGVSLSELLVTMFLTGIVGLIVVSFFLAFTNSFTQDRVATENTTTAALGMNDLTRIIRSGTEIPVQGQVLNDPVFVYAGDQELIINAFTDTDSAAPRPVRVRFSINASRELIEERFLASETSPGSGYWRFNSSSEGARVIARQLPNPGPGDPWLFTYLAADGSAFNPADDRSLGIDQRRSIAAVRVNLTVQADPTGRADPVTLRNTVGIPNLGVSRVGL